MRLVVDANALVSELLRQRGRDLLEHAAFELVISGRAWDEAFHELPTRLEAIERQGRLATGEREEMLAASLSFAEICITRVSDSVYAHLEASARARIPRDPDDWPTVALA